jgi:lysophospholipase L1-like esterase
MQRFVAPLVLLGAGALCLLRASGLLFWPALGLAAVGLALLVRRSLPRVGALEALPLAVGSVCAALFAAELALAVLERAVDRPLPPPGSEAGARYRAWEEAAPAGDPSLRLPPELREKIALMHRAWVLPQSWNRRSLAPVPGLKTPYLWHGALHVFDARKMRRSEPLPPRSPGRLRVAAVGDSFTYGAGIDAFWTWPAQLERMLGPEGSVEVLNLGVRGDASEDVLRVVREVVPELEPDVLVYGVCLNDFLPSRTLEGVPWPFPLPKKLKELLRQRTRLGRLVDERYGALLRRLGLRPSFYSQLLEDFEPLRERFARDVRAMNEFVTSRGLPPVVALVLDPRPRLEGPGRRLALAAEQAMRAAGMRVVDSARYARRYHGRDLSVSRWEAHPNEEANAIFASLLAEELRELLAERAPAAPAR